MATPPNPVQRISRAVAAACAPLGIKKHEIQVTGRGISIPVADLAVTADLSNGARVWRAVSKMTVHSVRGEADRTIAMILFEEPFEREWQVARRIAMHIAQTRIDAAIDEAAAG